MKVSSRYLPNTLTLLRFALAISIAALLLALPQPAYGAALVLFVVASFTDLCDGALARRLDAQTALGTTLDPLADKALVLGVLGALWALGQLAPLAQLATGVIFIRELTISALRILRARVGHPISASGLSRTKTFLQVTGAGLVLGAPALSKAASISSALGTAALTLAAVMGLTSGIAYLRTERVASNGLHKPSKQQTTR